MESIDKDREYKKRKYLINQLVKIGFLKELPYKSNKKYNFYEYDEKEIDLFIDSIINLKEEDTTLINFEFPLHKKSKDKNFRLYNTLFSPSYNEDITPFLSKLHEKIYPDKDISYEKMMKIFSPSVESLKSEYIYKIRKVIRGYKIKNETNSYILNQEKYLYKINAVKMLLTNLCYNNLFYTEDLTEIEEKDYFKNFANLLKERLETYSNKEAIVQFIIYDFFNLTFSKTRREKNYNKLNFFLEKFKNKLSEEINCKNFLKIRAEKIFSDFFVFLFLRAEHSHEIKRISEVLKFKNSNFNIPVLDKNIHFLYSANKLNENGCKFITCENFLELEIVKKYINKNNGHIAIADLKEELDKFNITKKEISLYLYQQNRPKDNFDKEQENIINFLNKFSQLKNCTLQAQKSFVSFILGNNEKIAPFNLTLKSLINNNIESKYLYSIFRALLNRELFIEKGGSISEYNNLLKSQKIVEEIYLMMDSIKSEERRIFYKNEFILSFLDLVFSLFKGKTILPITEIFL